MTDGNEARLVELLKQAQTMMVELSGRSAGAERDWDKAKALLDGARQIDGILAILAGRQAPEPSRVRPPVDDRRKLPYYYVEHDKLVKVGRRREGGTYEHRVTREHYDLIVGRLAEMAKQGRAFETRRLVEKCDVPAHEPLIVVNLLGEQGLLDCLRRGRWAFPDADGFAVAVRGVWDKLPRQ
jgi:hypothetical protein